MSYRDEDFLSHCVDPFEEQRSYRVGSAGASQRLRGTVVVARPSFTLTFRPLAALSTEHLGSPLDPGVPCRGGLFPSLHPTLPLHCVWAFKRDMVLCESPGHNSEITHVYRSGGSRVVCLETKSWSCKLRTQ